LLYHPDAVFPERAIRSVLAQTVDGPVEIIMVEGTASTKDNIGAVRAEVARAARPGITLKILRPGGIPSGGAGAFVTALGAATGRFYHVLYSDDFWVDPDKLRRQVALLEAHPALAGVGHRTILRAPEDGSENFQPQQDPLKTVLHLEDLLTGGASFHTSALLFRHSFADPATGPVTDCETGPATGQVAIPPIFHEMQGDAVRLLVHAAQGGIFYLPQTMSVHDGSGGGLWPGLDGAGLGEAGPDRMAPDRMGGASPLYAGLSDHGYLADRGAAKAAESLAGRLAAIAAHAPLTLRPVSLYPDQVMTAPRHRLTAITRITGLLDLETQLTALAAEARHEEALWLTRRFLTAITQDRNLARASRSRRVSSPEIDWHCAYIGGLIATDQAILPVAPHPQDVADGPVVMVVSGLARDRSGIWETVREMIALWRGRGRIVIVSTEMVPTMADIQEQAGPDVTILLNTDRGLVEKTAWLIWHVAQQKPSRILVIPARDDVVIAAGLRREHALQIHLVGCYDTGYLPCCHSYALDGYVVRRPYDLAWFRRIAPHRSLVHLPRLVPGLAVPGLAGPVPLGGGLARVTATAALFGDRLEGQYDYTLPVIVPLLLRSGVQRHIHAGALPDTLLARIRKELIRQDLPPGAFVHLPQSTETGADIGADLRAAGATLFLQGFPWPETAPLFSAMAAGLPVLAHRNYLHPALSLADLCPPGTPQWANGEELVTLVHGIGPDWIAERSRAICVHVAQHLSAGALLATLGDGFMAPVDPGMVPDMRVPDDPQSLRRLLSDLMQMTVFRV